MPTTSIDIRHTRDRDEIRRFAALVAQALMFPIDPEWTEREGIPSFRLGWAGRELAGGLTVQRAGHWFGGRTIASGLVRAVAVAPEYRRTGVASRLVGAQLEELHGDGVPLATLYASTQGVYRRAGFERAGSRISYRLPTAALDAADRSLAVRPVAPSDPSDRAELHRLHGERAAASAGHLDRTEWLWRRILDPHKMKTYAYFALSENGAGNRAEGFVAWHQEARQPPYGVLTVRDLIASTPAAARRLLTLLADQGSTIGSVTWPGGPCDPLLHHIANPHYEIEHYLHWMLRLVDVAEALAERGYPRGVRAEVELEVRDDLLPWNHDRFTLEVADGVAEVRRGGNGSGGSPITLDVRGLASIYSGFAAPAELVPTGLVVGDASDLARLGSIFAGPSPWLSDGF